MAKTQTFTAACSAVGGFGYAGRFTLYVKLTDRDGSSSTNKSTVDYEAYIENTSGGGTFTSKTRLYFYLNGSVIRDDTIEITAPRNGKYYIASGSTEIQHDENGNKNIGFQALINSTNYGISSSITNSFDLEPIARKGVLSINSVSATINTATINYSHLSGLFYHVEYSLNGGAWQSSSGYPSMTISSLTPNTSYTIRVRALNEDKTIVGDASNSISFKTYNIATITSAPNFNDENNVTIGYSNPFGNNVSSLQACISWTGGADIAYRDISKTGTSYTFAFTEDERNKFRQAATSNTLSVKFYVRTDYNGETYYSTATRTLTIVNANPTFVDFRFVDADDATYNLTGDYKAIIKGESNPYVYIPVSNKAIPNKYATMDKYRIAIGSQTAEVPYSRTSEVGTTLYNVSSDSVIVYAVDSRGNSTAKQLWASRYIDYFPPRITYVEAKRTDSVKEETTLYFSGVFWNGNFGAKHNEIRGCHYKYRLAGTSEWKGQVELTNLSISGNTFSYSIKMHGDLGAEGFDINNSYEISVAIMDYLNAREAPIFTLGPGLPGIAIYKNFVAIGQRYDTGLGGAFQVNGRPHVKSNRFTLDSSGSSGDNVFHEFYKNGSRAAWVGFGSNGSTDFSITNQTGGRVKCATSFEWESIGYSNEDCNNFKTSGIYYMSENNTNSPINYCRTLVMGASYSGDIAQLATHVSNGRTWVRGCSNGDWHPWLHLMGAQTLYYNASGSNGTITLSESASQFSYLEIFYRSTYNHYSSVRVYAPNGKSALLSNSHVFPTSGTLVTQSRVVLISGTSISTATGNEAFGEWWSYDNHIEAVNQIYIYQVVGYK